MARVGEQLDVVALLASSGVRASSSVRPMTPFMGVRISWLMLARKSLLARLAARRLPWPARLHLGLLAQRDVVADGLDYLAALVERPRRQLDGQRVGVGREELDLEGQRPAGAQRARDELGDVSGRSGGASSESCWPTTSWRRRPVMRSPARLKVVIAPVASQVQIRSLACSTSSSCCRVSRASWALAAGQSVSMVCRRCRTSRRSSRAPRAGRAPRPAPV